MEPAILPSIIGTFGVLLVLLAYGLLTAGRLSPHDARYPWLNIVGTLGIAFSLLYQWNLPSMVAQIVWLLISAAALVRIARRRAR